MDLPPQRAIASVTISFTDYFYILGAVTVLCFVARFVISALCVFDKLDEDGHLFQTLAFWSVFGLVFFSFLWLLIGAVLRVLGILTGIA